RSRTLRRSGGRRTPRRSDRSRALRRSGGRRTPRRSDRSRALRRSGGRRTPRRSDRSRAPRRSGGHRDTRHDSGLRVNWYDRRHWVRHWMVSGWTAGIGGHQASGHLARPRAPTSSGKAVGSESTGMTAGTGSDIGSSDWTAGHRVTRHQVIWLD
ncbi:unnamed protein product, partial [Staurois parvus]